MTLRNEGAEDAACGPPGGAKSIGKKGQIRQVGGMLDVIDRSF